ncbi:MAG: hypothetical protein ACRC7O_15790, partial [Fimbriiglobus sp.]
MPDWTAIERTLAPLPRRAVAAVASRAARRVVPVVAEGVRVFGPEAWEWMNAVDAAVRATEAFADGRAVSPFTLGIAAEIARATAAATADAARRVGPSPVVERLELAYAAAAFAADAARAATPQRAASLATQCFQSAAELADGIDRLIAFDVKAAVVGATDADAFGELWPF